MAKLLAFAGSARKDSINKKLITVAAQGATDAGAEVTLIDLADYPMPLFDQDLESAEGLPPKARELKQLMIEHDGFMIASPEYNSAFSPLLKNALDWISRAESNEEPPLAAFRGKTAALMATAPGALGGIRGLVFLRMLLGNIGVHVIPQQHAVPNGFTVFAEDGSMTDEKHKQAVQNLAKSLTEFSDKLNKD
ncbi:MAG: NAD(P)H-dependent oxidoreductase [Pseudomonadota bacterium]